MLSVKQVQDRLQDRNMTKIARATGLTLRTVMRVRSLGTCNTGTLEKLSNYFEEQESK